MHQEPGPDEAVPTPAKPRRSSYRAGLGVGTLSFIANGTISLVASIVIARLYGIDVIGKYALVYAVIAILWQLSTVGEQAGLVRALTGTSPREPRVTALFIYVLALSTGLTLVLGAVALVVACLLFVGPLDQPDLQAPAALLVISYVLFANPAWNIDTILLTFRGARDLFAVRFHQVVVSLAVAVILSGFVDTVWGLVLATAVSWATSFVHRLLITRRYLARVSRPALDSERGEVREIVKFGLKLTPGGLAAGAANEVGTWIAGLTGSVAGVGAYNRAWLLAQRFLEFQMRVVEILFPTLSERGAEGNEEGFDRAVADSLRYVAVLLFLPAAIGGGVAGGVMALYGPDFEIGKTALMILVLVPGFTAMTAVQTTALMARDRPLTGSAWAAIRLAVTITAAWILGDRIGIEGVALGVLTGVITQFTLQLTTTRHYLHSPLRTLWPVRQILGLVAAYCAGFAAAFAIGRLVPGVLGIPPATLAGAVAYGAAYLVVGGLLERDRERLAVVLARVRSYGS
jgi:O-antigen/teichoic acid export membrane protein